METAITSIGDFFAKALAWYNDRVQDVIRFFSEFSVWTIVVIIAAVVMLVLLIIGYFTMFRKAGTGGWKIFIPIYNVYTIWKISWGGAAFWLQIFFTVVAVIFQNIPSWSGNLGMVWPSIVSLCFYLIVFIMGLVQTFKTGRVFGHGFGYFLGLLFLKPLFVLILGVGSSKYVGTR